MKPIFVRGDFNGLFSELLCLSHSESCTTESGNEVQMQEGMTVTAFEEDWDEELGDCYLVATGIVERSPDWLSCRGSRWALRLDNRRCRHVASLDDAL